MKSFTVLALVLSPVLSFQPSRNTFAMTGSNSDMFGASTTTSSPASLESTPPVSSASSVFSGNKMKDQAAALRREAAELEIAMREEAREKGLPQEVIDKLIPMRSQPGVAAAVKESDVSQGSTSTAVLDTPKTPRTAVDVRSKLGYLNSGDAVRFTSELDRIKSRGGIQLWNSKDVSRSSYAANSLQLTSKTSIEPVNLRLDSVGFEYQKVLGIAVISATVLALASSQIGGQVGFLMGYASALFPILLVGIGSIAPELIGVVLNKFKFATDAEAKAKYARGNAAKFLVGYILGLPVSQFRTGGESNSVEFFQLRPSSASLGAGGSSTQAFARKTFKQVDIAPVSVVCVAGPTAECMGFKIAGGTNPSDVNLLYELINSVEPALSPDKAENHIRWSVLTAHEILNAHKDELDRLTTAFSSGAPLEECISIIEGI